MTVHFSSLYRAKFQLARESSTVQRPYEENGTVRQMNDPLLVKFMCHAPCYSILFYRIVKVLRYKQQHMGLQA